MRRLTKDEAARALLTYQALWPPRSLSGTEGMLAYIARVGSIQFDPVDVAGISPEIVFAARLRGFRREHLDRWLYKERLLSDVWDKNACIAHSDEFGALLEGKKADSGWYPRVGSKELTPDVWARLDRILEENEFVSGETLEGDKLLRGALLKSVAAGEAGVHHRKGRERYFSRIDRLFTPTQLQFIERDAQESADFYVLRRIGSIGLLWNRRSDAFLGIRGMDSAARIAAYERLESRGEIVRVAVDGINGPLFHRAGDEAMFNAPDCAQRASFIAPLDNLLWDRKLIEQLFGFHYSWEVYTPREIRKYGSYTLPVLYGDKFVARVQLARRDGRLWIENWWWEQTARRTKMMAKAIESAFTAHAKMLSLTPDPNAVNDI